MAPTNQQQLQPPQLPGKPNNYPQQQMGGIPYQTPPQTQPQHLQPPNMQNQHLMPPQQQAYGMHPMNQQSIAPQVNFSSDPFVGRVFPSTHIRR